MLSIATIRFINGVGYIADIESLEVSPLGIFLITKFESINKVYRTFVANEKIESIIVK